MFNNWNHWLLSKNWNWVSVGSNKKSREILTFKIKSDQNNEKFRIKKIRVLQVKKRIKQPIKGKVIKNNNIRIILLRNKADYEQIWTTIL